MNYSISQITTVADCDELLQIAQTEKEDLDFRKLQQDRQYRSVTEGTTGVEAELSAVNAEITGLEAVVAGLPDGDTKDEFESKLVKLRHKKFLLEERRERYGILALLQKEYAISCIEKQQAETVLFIDEVTRRRMEV